MPTLGISEANFTEFCLTKYIYQIYFHSQEITPSTVSINIETGEIVSSNVTRR